MMDRQHSIPGFRVLVATAAGLVAAVAVFYVSIADSHGSRVGFVTASLLAGVALPLLGAATAEPRTRLFTVALGAFTLLIWTVLGAASIGLFILPGAVLLLIATGRAVDTVRSGEAGTFVAAAALVAVAVAVLGLQLTTT